MVDDRQFPVAPLQLSEAQEQVLRKHLQRNTMSLDDAATLLGVDVDDLASKFQGRRASYHRDEDDHAEHRSRHGAARRYAHDAGEHYDAGGGDSLHAPERRTAVARGNSAWWAGGVLGGIALVGGLALLSGVPQSLLFPPRGVSEHKDATITATAETPLQPNDAQIADGQATIPAADPAAISSAEPQPVEPVPDPSAGQPVDPAADPTFADPNAQPPVDPAVAEAPLPAAPEEVAPAVAVAQAETAFDPAAAPASPEPTMAPAEPAPAPAPVPSGPTTLLYATRAAAVRDAPTATGSTSTGQLKRGDSVSGVAVAGADGKSQWLHIESGPGAGGYVSFANMAKTPRPAVVQQIGQPRTLVQGAPLHAAPDDASTTLDTLSPGISVQAAAEVEGGWIEIQRRAGGVGYIRKEAFQ